MLWDAYSEWKGLATPSQLGRESQKSRELEDCWPEQDSGCELKCCSPLVPTTAPDTDTQDDKDVIAGYAAWLKDRKTKYPAINALTISPANWPSAAAATKRQEANDEAACEITACDALLQVHSQY